MLRVDRDARLGQAIERATVSPLGLERSGGEQGDRDREQRSSEVDEPSWFEVGG